MSLIVNRLEYTLLNPGIYLLRRLGKNSFEMVKFELLCVFWKKFLKHGKIFVGKHVLEKTLKTWKNLCRKSHVLEKTLKIWINHFRNSIVLSQKIQLPMVRFQNVNRKKFLYLAQEAACEKLGKSLGNFRKSL